METIFSVIEDRLACAVLASLSSSYCALSLFRDTSAGYMDSIVQLAHVVAFLGMRVAPFAVVRMRPTVNTLCRRSPFSTPPANTHSLRPIACRLFWWALGCGPSCEIPPAGRGLFPTPPPTCPQFPPGTEPHIVVVLLCRCPISCDALSAYSS